MTQRSALLAGRYLLRERIGAGGMGQVWRATDEVLGRTVAVKVVLPALVEEPAFVRRFLAEARAMASVAHPGVVAIHDFHGDGAGAYLVMEFVDGEPLSRVLGRVGRLGPAVTMDLVRQAAIALQAVHDRGIVHRDVKPANLLLRSDGTLALTDFGIALASGHTALTASGAILGTPSYLAPEQVMGQAASPRSDVYALGVVAYECLAGRRPFVGENPFAVAMQRVGQPPPPLGPDVPPAVAAVVSTALALDPARRWPSAAEFAAAAERAVVRPDATTVSVIPAPASPVAPPPVRPDAQPAEPLYAQLAEPLYAQPVGAPDAQAAEPLYAQSVGAPPARAPRHRWPVAMAAAVAVLAVIGGGVALLARTPATGSGAAGGAHAASADTHTASAGLHPAGTAAASTAPTGSAAPSGPLPTGFVACALLVCPTAPMCWHGLNDFGDVAQPPRPADCGEPHYWETFAITRLPAGASTDHDLSHLTERPDIAAICSPSVMAQHSADPAHTRGWQIEARAIPADAYTVLVHCLGGSLGGETTGAVFHA